MLSKTAQSCFCVTKSGIDMDIFSIVTLDRLGTPEASLYFRFLSIIFNQLRNKLLANYLRNGSNDLATVRISAFCVAMLSNNSFFCKENIFFESTNCR